MKKVLIAWCLVGLMGQWAMAAGPAGKVATTGPAAASTQPAIKLTVLYDNYKFDQRLESQWGFSCLITGAEKTVLFDTGGKASVLLDNMAKMNVDPKSIDTIVLSHNHWDHNGGLLAVLDKNGRINTYLPPSCPKDFVDQAASRGANVVIVNKPVEICKGVAIVGPLGDKIIEQSLAVNTRQGLVLITGCSHPGIAEIISEAKKQLKQDVYLVCGGMHLFESSENTVKQTVSKVKDLGLRKVGASHCSGAKAIEEFKKVFGDNYVPLGVGRVLDF